MKSAAALVAVVWMLSCQAQLPMPSPYLEVPKLTAAGLVRIDAYVENALGTTMTLRVRRADEVVFERTMALGIGEDHVTLQPEVGLYVVELEVRRGGEVVISTSAEFRAVPTLTLSRQVRQHCSDFAPLDDEGREFSCDWSIIDADGGQRPGRALGESRIVHTLDGALRWVHHEGLLFVETPDGGTTNAVEFVAEADWVASAELAVSGSSLALLQGGALQLIDLDGREFIVPPDGGARLTEPLAVSSRDGRHAMMFGTKRFDQSAIQSRHSVCFLEFSTRWRLTACPTLDGVLVRAEPDGSAVFQLGQQLLLVDLLDAEHPQVVRTLQGWEKLRLGQSLTRAPALDYVVPVGEGWPPTLLADGGVSEWEMLRDSATAEILWGHSNRRLNRTFWAPLP